MTRSIAIGAALLAARAAAHGYVPTFTLDGTDHEGFERWNPSPDPNAIGWSFTTSDEGPEMEISSPDFVCRSGSEPAQSYGEIAAGGKVDIVWTSADKETNPDGWAESHKGPIMTYIAPCPNDDCTSVDKTELRWTKIQEAGLLDGPANTEGLWATDEMRANDGMSSATIPSSIASGKYVLRHEIIALHRAHLSEPEFYMQCANIEVTDGGDDDLSDSGVVASELYSTSDEQIFGFSVYDGSEDSWPIPGPELYSGAESTDGNSGNSGNSTESPKPEETETVTEPEPETEVEDETETETETEEQPETEYEETETPAENEGDSQTPNAWWNQHHNNRRPARFARRN